MRKLVDEYRIARNSKEAREKSSELLQLINLILPDDFLKRHPSRLSGGRVQRIARAISVNPKFLVGDEAVSVINALLRIEVLDLLLDLKKRFDLTCLFRAQALLLVDDAE